MQPKHDQAQVWSDREEKKEGEAGQFERNREEQFFAGPGTVL